MKMLSKMVLGLSGVALLCGGVMASGGKVLHVIVPETGKVIGQLKLGSPRTMEKQKEITADAQKNAKSKRNKIRRSLKKDVEHRDVDPQTVGENIKKPINKEALRNALRKAMRKNQQRGDQSQEITGKDKSLEKEGMQLTPEMLEAIQGLSTEQFNEIKGTTKGN